MRNTYYVDETKEIPEQEELRRESSIRYYQWIPFILLFEAFFFFAPYVMWRIFCQRSGIDIRDMVEAATNYRRAMDDSKRDQLMAFMASTLDQYVDDSRRQSNNRETMWLKKCFLIFFPTSGRYMGDYLRNLFLFIKLLYILNVIGQVILLSALLDQPFWTLGFTVLQYLYQGKGWNFHSRYFPKVTLWYVKRNTIIHHVHKMFNRFLFIFFVLHLIVISESENQVRWPYHTHTQLCVFYQ